MKHLMMIRAQRNKICWVIILFVAIHMMNFNYVIKPANTAFLFMISKTDVSVMIATIVSISG